jgi:hypothetical protein
MSAVPAIKEQHALVGSAEAAALIQVISRAASDPAVDINKLERLMEMHERITAKEAEKAYTVSMAACQADIRQVAPDADNPQTRSKYATYAKLDSVLRPIYTRHGFALSFGEADAPKPEYVRVTCDVSHIGGHTKSYHRDMPADGKGAKGGDVMTKTHAAGAAGSYGARYLLKGIFNVAIGEYDNDGNGDGSGLSDDVRAMHLTAIDSAPDTETLKDFYKTAYRAAEAVGDKGSLRLFEQHKDARKKALAPQS